MEIFFKRMTTGILLCFILLAGISFNAVAQQCSLGKGDLVITGYDLQDDGTNGLTKDDKFSFLLLRDVPTGTVIFFTDYGWTAANTFQVDAQAVSDGVIKWTADKAYAAGTEIYVYCKYRLLAFDKLNAPAGTITGVTESFATRANPPGGAHEYMSLGLFSGDQIFAFTGSFASPALLAGISMNHDIGTEALNTNNITGWDVTLSAGSFASDRSMLPAVLASGAQNLSVILHDDAGDPDFNTGYTERYKKTTGGFTTGPPAVVLAQVNNRANWEFKSDGTSFSSFLSGETFLITGAAITNQPQDKLNICAGSGTSFTAVAINACSYQWQVSTNGGSIFTDITDGGVYSGSATNTLSISNVTGLGTNFYRLNARGASNLATSNPAQLTLSNQLITLSPVLAAGIYKTAYSQPIIVSSGGAAPFVYSATPGTLPPGLTLSSGGVLSGTPTATGNYSFTISVTGACVSSGSQSFSMVIAPKALTATFAAVTKVYNGNAAANVVFDPLNAGSGLVAPDVVSVTYTSAAYNNPGVAAGKAITLTGLGLTGASALNYVLNPVTVTGAITAASIVPSLVLPITKVYDGNVTATLTGANYSFTGKVGTEDVTLNNPVTGTYSLKNIGNRTVSVTGLALTGADAGNYIISTTSVSATGTITAASIIPSLVLPLTKVYNGNTAAALTGANYSFTGKVGTENVALNNPATGIYSLKDVGSRTVTVTGLLLTGTDAGNYILSTTSVSGTGTITSAIITPLLAGTITKVYDGNMTAALTGANYSFTGKVGTENVTLNNPAAGSYDLKDAGNRTVSVAGLALSGTDAGNYTLSTLSLTAPGTITSAIITPLLAGTITKVYDGNTTAALTGANYSFTGNIGTENVALNNPATGTYSLKNIGNRTVSVTGLMLTGTDAGNYTLSTTNLTAPGTITLATITPLLAGTITKVYDGNTTAALTGANYSFTGKVGTENVTLNNPAAGSYDLKDAGNRTVSVAGLALTGTDAGNYTLSTLSLTAPGTITSAIITPLLAGTITKVYDGNVSAALTGGNYSFTGKVGTDNVALNNPVSGIYNLKNAGNRTVTVSGIALTGTDAANYSLSATSLTAPGIITPAIISPILSGTITKVYDGNTTAALTGANYSLAGMIGADDVALNNPAAGTYDLKNKGNRTVTVSGLSLTGADAANYSLLTTSTTAPGTITSATIVPVLAGTITKIYDGNITAALTGANYSFTGKVGTENVVLNNPSSGTYDLKNAGNRTVSVSGITLTGTDAANYSLSATSLTAPGTITSAAITPVLAGTITKVYDGNIIAALTDANYSFTGNIGADNVNLNNPSAGTYDLKNTGNRTVTVSGLSLTGTDAANYSLLTTSATAPGTITPATIVPVLAGTITKVYDGNTTAALTGANYSFSGNIGTDNVTLNNPVTGSYDLKDAGNRTVSVAGITLTGTDAANYSLSTTNLTAPGTITSATIIPVLAGMITKVYDGNTAAVLTSANYSFTGNIGSDNVSLNNPPAGTYDLKNAGNRTVTVNGITLTGTNAANYTLSATSLTAPGTITPATIIPVLAGTITKVYDGNTTAVLNSTNYSFTGKAGTDDVLLNDPVAGVYSNKNIGGRTVIVTGLALTGADAGNYTLSTLSLTAPGTITSAIIIPVLAGTITKVYDGNTTAVLTGANYSFSGKIGAETVNLNNPVNGTYSSKDAGNRIVTVGGITLTGADAVNYTLSTTNLTAPGTITKGTIIAALSGVITKVYDGNATATLTAANYSLTGKVATEDIMLNNPAQGTYDNKNTATGKTVTVSGITMTGADAGNYVLAATSLNSTGGVITAQPLSVTADNKEMIQGTAVPPLTLTYSGFVNGETISVFTTPANVSTTANSGSLAGNYPITVNGAVAANYAISFVNGVLTVKPGLPTSISLAAADLYENKAAGALAGTLSSTSLDPNATFTYTLVGGAGDTDNALFDIAGNLVKTKTSLSFVQKSVYSIRVRSTTQYGLTLDKQFSITLIDVNEAPTLNAIAGLTQCNTTSKQTIALSGISPGPEPAQITTLSISSDKPAMFSDLKVSQENGGNGTLTYRLANNTVSGTVNITVTVKDNGGTANGGVDTYSRTFVLTINPLPVISIVSSAGLEISKGITTKLTASGGTSYVWANASGIIGSQNTSVLTIRPAQTATYTVTATNATGCTSTQQITIMVDDDYKTIDATNILTPNGDGVNDLFVIRNIDMYPNNEVKIFDRAGRLIYSKKSYDNSWDGTISGNPLSEGTYFYVLDFGNGRSRYKGFITLVRNK